MKNFVQHGDIVTVVAPANVTSGSLVRVGHILGVAATDALSGADVELKVSGVFDLPKTSAQAWAVGAPIYAVSGTNVLTSVAGTGNYLVGVAAAAAANPSAVGRVRLNGTLGLAVTA